MLMCPSNPIGCAYKRNYRKKSLAATVLFFCPVNVIVTAAFELRKSVSSVRLPIEKTTSFRYLTLKPLEESHKDSLVQVTASSLTQPAAVQPSRWPSVCRDFCRARAPGIAFCVILARFSMALSKTPLGNHVSPLLWATILGMAYGNMGYTNIKHKALLGTGVKFAKGRLLRLGIILYGFKITLQQIAGISFNGLATDIFMVASTLALGINLGTKFFGLDEPTSTLIGSGAAICGCSAVLATQPVVGGESHQVSAAVGTVVLGGTASMFLYPLLARWVPFLASNAKLMGIYTGSTIHEVAGVVAAGNAMGPDVASVAVVTKLARVLLLAPVLTTLSWLKNQKCLRQAKQAGEETHAAKENSKIVLPWFAFGFVAVSALNSIWSFPTALVSATSKTSAFCLLCAMGALGMESDFSEIRKLGPKPLWLATTLWGWLVFGGLGVARFFCL